MSNVTHDVTEQEFKGSFEEAMAYLQSFAPLPNTDVKTVVVREVPGIVPGKPWLVEVLSQGVETR